MSQSASKRRICSYDMVEVRPDGYLLTETEGEMYFCNARCLCVWAVQLATRPNLADGRKLPGVQLTQPTGEQRAFADVEELAKWSVANALDDGKQIGVITPNVKNRTIENFYHSLRAAKGRKGLYWPFRSRPTACQV